MISQTDIIPCRPILAKVQASHEWDLEAICTFTAIGFFLDQDTYFKDHKVLPPASNIKWDEQNGIWEAQRWFKWEYNPRDIAYKQVLEEFSGIFETVMQEQTQNKKVVLPLSGGLDSRTQAAALKNHPEVFAYSYQFQNGYPETKIAKHIADKSGFEFQKFTIHQGYLWDIIEDLYKLNQGYSNFTAPRQMAVMEQLRDKGNIFSLGHWGDVLCNDMGVPSNLDFNMQLELLQTKLLKKGGLELAENLWQAWGLKGTFNEYFRERVATLLQEINIPHEANAQIRAFKSLYWAPRWTSVNLAIFEEAHPVALPYYDQRICEFICSVPEAYLKNRQLQIDFIKTKAPELAKITWQDARPFNLYNHNYNRAPYNWPYRAVNKGSRLLKKLTGKPYVQRNWELQFLGHYNQRQLENHILNTKLKEWIPETLIKKYLEDFKAYPSPQTAHPVEMLLVLAMAYKNGKHE
jgi:hypothetical protein